MVRLTRINGSTGLSFSDEEVKVRTLQGEKEGGKSCDSSHKSNRFTDAAH